MVAGYEIVFRQMSPALVILRPNKPLYTIIDANDAYLKLTNSKLADIVGKGVFEAFPENSEHIQTEFGEMTRRNLDLALETKEPQPTFLVKYAIKHDDEFVDLFWTVDNVPIVLNGEVVYIAQHPKLLKAFNK